MESFKSLINKIVPDQILLPIQRLHGRICSRKQLKEEAQLIKTQKEKHFEAIKNIKNKKEPLNVVFFATFDSVWKYDKLYQLMTNNPRFNTTILVCPVINYGRDNMLLNMNKCYDLFISKGYNVVKAYNSKEDNYLDVKKELNPDIIFYTNPYEGLIDNKYFIKNFTDTLTCYVDYFYSEGYDWKFQCDLILHNLVWKRYCEHKELYNECKSKSRNRGTNCVYSGYPGTDAFIDKRSIFKDVWKIKDRKLKRIIWAPHHTITAYAFVNYSTFLYYYDFMFEMAEKYKDKIQICFKPHPILKNRLDIEWGVERRKAYYEKWENLPNGMLDDGQYDSLFMTSDAIIHDCSSFIAEYLYTGKPAMFLSKNIPFEKQYNKTAISCLNKHYIGKNKQDIEDFILNMINENDPMLKERMSFVHDFLMPPNGKLASENIMNDIVKELNL